MKHIEIFKQNPFEFFFSHVFHAQVLLLIVLNLMLMQKTVSVSFKIERFSGNSLEKFHFFLHNADDIKTLDEIIQNELDSDLDWNSPTIQYIGKPILRANKLLIIQSIYRSQNFFISLLSRRT